jgi:hypothetical protein
MTTDTERFALLKLTRQELEVVSAGQAAQIKSHPEAFINPDGTTNQHADIMKTKHDTVKNSISNIR